MISRFISDKRNIFFSRFTFSQIKVVYLHRNNHLPIYYNDSIMNIRLKLYSVIISLGCSCLPANAAVVQNFMNDDNTTVQHYNPTAENLASRKDFQDSKFGIFLHWGLYSMLATGEWTMTNLRQGRSNMV